MSTIQFDESQFKLKSKKILGDPEIPTFIRFLVTRGVVKTEKQALFILLLCVGAIIGLSVFLLKTNGATPATLDQEYLSLN